MAVNDALIAKYPFLSQGRGLLQDVEKIDYLEIENAVNNTAAFMREPVVLQPKDAKTEVKRLALSRLLLTALGNPSAARQFARNYGKLLKKRLRDEDDAVLLDVGGDFLPTLVVSGSGFAVSLVDFVKANGGLKDAGLQQGVVYLDRGELVSLLVAGVVYKLSSFASNKRVPAEFKNAAEDLGRQLPREASGRRFKGKYLQLECVKRILSGLPEGKRFYGAMSLAIACLNDGLAKEQAQSVMQDYVNANEKGSEEYTLREASATLDWVYNKGSIGFSCNVMRSQDLIDGYCGNCQFKKRV